MQACHHFNDADGREDFDRSINPGSSADVSIFLHTYRNGLRGGPIRDVLDPALLRIVRVPGTSIAVLMYEAVTVGIAHIDQFDNLGAIEIAPRFAAMVERFAGRAAL